MRRRHGHQHWWPAETPFEVCVGAILTQNTSWTNVEHAIRNLKAASTLGPEPLYRLPLDRLARLIRPAGYYNLKARRLQAFVRELVERFGGHLDRMLDGPTPSVRERLLRIHGIGPETADCILLYAAEHLSFVVDAYTRRVFSRHGWCTPDAAYDSLRELCTAALSQKPRRLTLDYWRDYHAQMVLVGKDYCRRHHPRCDGCPLRELLASSSHYGCSPTAEPAKAGTPNTAGPRLGRSGVPSRPPPRTTADKPRRRDGSGP